MSDSKSTREEISEEERAASRARSNANLRKFKPGQSGNPSGKPKGSLSPTAQLRKAYKKNHREIAAAVVDSIIKDRNAKSIELLFDRLDGPVPREAALGPVQIAFIGMDPKQAFSSQAMRRGSDEQALDSQLVESQTIKPEDASPPPYTPHPPHES